MLLMVAGTICIAIIIAIVSIGVIEVVHPETDTNEAAIALGAVLNTLVGLLAGYLAGRTQRSKERQHDRAEEQV
jgi:nitrogen fixation/metabolism regulation signal transduction histidine kinase